MFTPKRDWDLVVHKEVQIITHVLEKILIIHVWIKEMVG
jgi:hypothetical protein